MADPNDLGNLRYKFYGGSTDAITVEINALAAAVTAGCTFQDFARNAVSRKRQVIAAAAAVQTVDLALGGVVDVTLTNSITTLTFPTVAAGGQYVTFILRQPAAGSKTVAWPAAFVFTGGAAPTLTITALKVDIIEFISDGTVLRELSRTLNQS